MNLLSLIIRWENLDQQVYHKLINNIKEIMINLIKLSIKSHKKQYQNNWKNQFLHQILDLKSWKKILNLKITIQ